jgi:hypothetical protein
MCGWRSLRFASQGGSRGLRRNGTATRDGVAVDADLVGKTGGLMALGERVDGAEVDGALGDGVAD